MAFLDDSDLASLEITKMVFHLVGPKPEQFIRLEAVDPGKFAPFFLERIRSVNAGLPYKFSDASATRTRLDRIAGDAKLFQDESEALADDFQRQHGGTAAAGAFLVFVLKMDSGPAFALLKYDDEQVLTYDFKDGAHGRKRVNLAALERTFVQNREALQKAALIRLTDGGGELSVLDRRNQQKVARYFENFLDAVRIHEDAALTEKLVNVTRQLIRENKGLVPPDVYREMSKRTYDAASGGGSLAIDNQKSFLEAVMGQALPDDSPIVVKYQAALRRERIDGVPVKFDITAVKAPRSLHYDTENDIRIRVPTEMKHKVTVEKDRIIINDTLKQQYDAAD
jgi:hypothetical protein